MHFCPSTRNLGVISKFLVTLIFDCDFGRKLGKATLKSLWEGKNFSHFWLQNLNFKNSSTYFVCYSGGVPRRTSLPFWRDFPNDAWKVYRFVSPLTVVLEQKPHSKIQKIAFGTKSSSNSKFQLEFDEKYIIFSSISIFLT